MDDVTKPEVGQIVAPKRSRFNISGINVVNLKIGKKIARDTLSIITD